MDTHCLLSRLNLEMGALGSLQSSVAFLASEDWLTH